MSQKKKDFVHRMLQELGFSMSSPKVSLGNYLPLKKGSTKYLADLKDQFPLRRRELEGKIADSILRIRNTSLKENTYKPLLVVLVQIITQGSKKTVEKYLKEYAPEFNWILMDESGAVASNIAGVERTPRFDSRVASSALAPREHQSGTKGKDAFSPTFQWILKNLILNGIDGKYWGGKKPFASHLNQMTLKECTGVSQPYISLFLKLFEMEEYIKWNDGNYMFPNILRLLEDWAVAYRTRNIGKMYSVESAHSESPMQIIEGLQTDIHPPYKIVLGSHVACKLMGVGWSNSEHLALYVSHEQAMTILMKQLRLVPVNGKSQITFIVPKAAESVFSGAVDCKKGIECTDILQTYLDVHKFGTRGDEQGDYILRKVLTPHFRRNSWL